TCLPSSRQRSCFPLEAPLQHEPSLLARVHGACPAFPEVLARIRLSDTLLLRPRLWFPSPWAYHAAETSCLSSALEADRPARRLGSPRALALLTRGERRASQVSGSSLRTRQSQQPRRCT